MNAAQRRKARRADEAAAAEIEAEIDRRVDQGFTEERERHAAELQEMRTRHAAALAEETAEHVKLINENTRLRSRIDALEAEVSMIATGRAEAEHALLKATCDLETTGQRLAETQRELDQARAEDRDAAKLRRRLESKGERIRHLELEIQRLKGELAEDRRSKLGDEFAGPLSFARSLGRRGGVRRRK